MAEEESYSSRKIYRGNKRGHLTSGMIHNGILMVKRIHDGGPWWDGGDSEGFREGIHSSGSTEVEAVYFYIHFFYIHLFILISNTRPGLDWGSRALAGHISSDDEKDGGIMDQ